MSHEDSRWSASKAEALRMARPGSFGKYQPIATLDQGGMADVFLALAQGPVGFNKLVVLKALREEFAKEPTYRTMFFDEARLAARLNHPNVIHVYEVGKENGHYFIAMEYLEGQPLSSLAYESDRRKHKLPQAVCGRVLYDALAGLHYAHELRDYDGTPLNIVHRDIKPSNVFLTYDGQIKLVDFGIAKATVNTNHTVVGMTKGTVGYMAPEQAKGALVDRRADIFSVGIVLWELLARRRLVPTISATSAFHLLYEQPIPYLTEIDATVEVGLADIVARALKINPEERFQTAQEMHEALHTFFTSDGLARTDEMGLLVDSMFREVRKRVSRLVQTCVQSAVPLGTDSTETLLNITRETPITLEPVPSADETLREPLILSEDDQAPSTSLSSSVPLEPLAQHEVSGPSARSAQLNPTVQERYQTSKRNFIKKWPLYLTAGLFGIGCIAGVHAVTTTLLSRGQNKAGQDTFSQPSHKEPSINGDQGLIPATKVVRLHGSFTLGADLMPALAEAFLNHQGAYHITRLASATTPKVTVSGELPALPPVLIEISGGGSSTALTALADGSCDIGMSSRRIKNDENERLKQRGLGDMMSATNEHVVALDGIAILVHPNNTLRTVSLSELTQVFSGDIADWSHLRGQPGPIHIYAWGDTSGTYDLFRTLVLGNHALVSSAKRFNSGEKLPEAVAADSNGIGFGSFIYAGDAKALAVHEANAEPMVPTVFTIATEDYPLSRRLYLYTTTKNDNPWAQELVRFALSPEGQKAIQSVGFVDLSIRVHDPEACGKRCPARYRTITRKARRLAVNFRFLPGTIALDNRALPDVDRLVMFLQNLKNPKVILIGFSDPADAPYALELSRERAIKVDEELRARGVHASVVEGFGQDMPIGWSDNEISRDRNRRVEVWIESDSK